ncbi:hypothetical protein GB937_003683 [Aspergillus fischeri]|nr:hypothetical protein GB937_003683 [Aspergillus fischeri]
MATEKEGQRERINAISSAKPIIFSDPGTGKLQWTVTTESSVSLSGVKRIASDGPSYSRLS